MTAITPITGGIDSAFLAWRHLTMTDEPLVTYRCTYDNPVNEGEQQAANQIVAWLKANVRDFEFRIIPTTVPKGEYMGIHAVREGARLVDQGVGDRLLIARLWSHGEANPVLRSPALRARQRIYAETTSKGSLQFPFVDEKLDKPHAHRDLPPNLMALTVKCNKAELVDGRPVACGTCVTGCRYNALCVEMLSQGQTPEQIIDYYMRLRRIGPYYGLPMTDRTWIRRWGQLAMDTTVVPEFSDN